MSVDPKLFTAIAASKENREREYHYNDYDVFKSPLSDFKEEIERAGLQDKIIYLEHGSTYEFDSKRNNQTR